jgi:uncharacterized protein YndB with AHSA1/START domain
VGRGRRQIPVGRGEQHRPNASRTVIDPIELTFTIECSPEHAFDVWTARASTWWPAAHTVSAEPGLRVTFEPEVGGRIYERTIDGVEHDWGEVIAWDPPRHLGYLWHIRRDRGDATEVTITFAGDSDATTVVIVHRGWERLGERGPTWREKNEAGWAGVLPDYRRACVTVDAVEPKPGH